MRSSGRDDLRAYLYGYICHYALDAAIHPYVIYISGKHLPAFYPERLHKSLHMLLEGGILKKQIIALAADVVCAAITCND